LIDQLEVIDLSPKKLARIQEKKTHFKVGKMTHAFFLVPNLLQA
jgi:hypothetical protein